MRCIHATLLLVLAPSAVSLGSVAALLPDDPRAQNPELLSAICPIVYSLDETSAERGYRYIFYGNAFFIDKDGYLLTAAHVLTDFQNGGKPQILLRRPEAPPSLVKVEAVASDPLHDIAILRAIPNPFEHDRALTFLTLGSTKPVPGLPILTLALRPAELQDPHSFDAAREDKSLADVLQYTAIPLNKGQPKSELFLFNHEVLRGQSGAPILSRQSREVVGIIEGQWLHGIPRPSPTSPGNRGTTVGAGVPIVYAVALLDQQSVPWKAGSSK